MRPDLGLTQSAVTRQIQQLEEVVGTTLLKRTTRAVNLTEAGVSLLGTADHLLKEMDLRMSKFGERYLDQPPVIRLGLSHSIAHSHLPGLFSHFRRTRPDARLLVTYESSNEVREKLGGNALDIAIVAQPSKEPKDLLLVHSFVDEFVIVTQAPGQSSLDGMDNRQWIALDRSTTTGALISEWIAKIDPNILPLAEFSNFDAIINLVAQGMGSSIVPRRALRLYGTRLPIREIEPKSPLSRSIGVYRSRSSMPDSAVEQFVESILFGWKSPGD